MVREGVRAAGAWSRLHVFVTMHPSALPNRCGSGFVVFQAGASGLSLCSLTCNAAAYGVVRGTPRAQPGTAPAWRETSPGLLAEGKRTKRWLQHICVLIDVV